MIKVDNGCGIVARLRGIAASEVEAQFALNVKCCASPRTFAGESSVSSETVKYRNDR